MLAADTSKRPSLARFIADGDLIIVYERHDAMKAVNVRNGAVAPTGHVYTFNFHEQRAALAREDFERTVANSVVTVGVQDIQGVGFPEEFIGRADAVFLDVPQPWLAIPSAANMLRPDGTTCSFSPCIEQVQHSCKTLSKQYTDVRTFKVLLRNYDIRVKSNPV